MGLNEIFTFNSYLGDFQDEEGSMWFSQCVMKKDIDKEIRQEMYFKKIIVNPIKGTIRFITRTDVVYERKMNFSFARP